MNFEFLIQNYNKSRIHSFRGVRCFDMTLNGSLIFQGEIARYCVLFVCVRQLFVCFTVKTCSGFSISCDKREKQNINTDLSMITLSVTKLQRPRFVLCGLLHPSISSLRAIFVLKNLPSQQLLLVPVSSL